MNMQAGAEDAGLPIVEAREGDMVDLSLVWPDLPSGSYWPRCEWELGYLPTWLASEDCRG